MDLVALFCDLDDFYQVLAPVWQICLLLSPGRHRRRAVRLSVSEMIKLVIAFQTSPYRNFKHFYLAEVRRHWRAEFPDLVSYQLLLSACPQGWCPEPLNCKRVQKPRMPGVYRQLSFTGLP
jgi:hypothetical protein